MNEFDIDEMMILTYIIIIIGGLESLAYCIVLILKGPTRKWARLTQTIPLMLLFLSWPIFFAWVWGAENNYQVAIDPIDQFYSPLSHDHILSMMLYLCLSWWGLYSLWKGGLRPPLLQVVLISFVAVGMLLCLAIIGQLSAGELLAGELSAGDNILMTIAPSVQILVSCWLLVTFIRQTSKWSEERVYRNPLLNYLNKISQRAAPRTLIILILLPVYLFISAILILFGQEPDSLVKVMTETTDWTYSRHTHPPYLDHTGHYLCTVAVCGTPSLVKPLRLGTRHGHSIVVNRQLLIANAFEDLIQRKFPTTHKIIRSFYDRYGYPVSRHINTTTRSNAIFIMMKPVEIFFLVIIYLFSEQPEQLINDQYRL